MGDYAWSPAVYYSKMKRKCAQHVFLNGTFLNDELVSSIAETEIVTTFFYSHLTVADFIREIFQVGKIRLLINI